MQLRTESSKFKAEIEQETVHYILNLEEEKNNEN